MGALTDGLHMELKPYGIHVCGLYPSHTYSRFVERCTDGERADWEKAMTPEAVARPGLCGLAENRRRVAPGAWTKFTLFAAWLSPSALLLPRSHNRARARFPEEA